jgi:hypothetical protein
MLSSRKSTAPAVFVAAAIATALASSGSAWSQNSGSGLGLEEITVNASKVEENLMQVPLAVTALS